MCGIAGYFGRFAGGLLEDFQRRLAYRGPDGYGLWKDESAGVGLAHRRLSIIDLSTAASQPMAAVNGRYQVVFNGEIYNFKSLIELGRGCGYNFNANSDTAILAPLYDQFGPAMLDKLEGMFAFAIYDTRKREMFVARDHVGIKPLYYALTPDGFVFASELKALVGVPGLDTRTDVAAMADYLTLLWSPGERTMVRGIKKLLPGHFLKLRVGDSGQLMVEQGRWYTPPLPAFEKGGPVYDGERTPEKLLELLDFVVAEQCTSDVPVGAFLSGGVDSSALVASMVATGHAPAMTYCVGFEGAGMTAEGFSDDLSHARIVAHKLGVEMRPLMVDPSAILGRLPDLAVMLDEPQADPAPLFVEDICKMARADGVKVLLSGTGGDDVMSGYRRHVTARWRQKLAGAGGWVGDAMVMGSGLLRGNMKRRVERLGGLLACGEEEFLLQAFMTNSVPDAWQLLRPEWREELAKGWRNNLYTAREESRGHDLLNRLLYMELFGFLPDHNLNYTDKAGMAAGVEARVPLVDRRIMAFMAGVDPALKLKNLDAKWFFKEALKHRLPHEVLHRSKAGFGAPIRVWLAGPGKALVQDTLLGSDVGREWFDQSALKTFFDRTMKGEVDGAYALLAACMVVWWQERLGRRLVA